VNRFLLFCFVGNPSWLRSRRHVLGDQADRYDEQVYSPLAEAETIADLEAYCWPAPTGTITPRCPGWPPNAAGERSPVTTQPSSTTTTCCAGWSARWRRFEVGGAFFDITQVTDDFGSQHGLLISPRIFEDFYRAPIQRAIDLAKSYRIIVFHHDDGDMRPLLPTLVNMGIEVLNPVQWRHGDWDWAALKAEI
jgi:hypothetical protein